MKHALVFLILAACSTATTSTPPPVVDVAPPAQYASIPRYEAGSAIQPPKVTHRVAPQFARPTNGMVTVEVVVDADGTVRDAWYVAGDPALAPPVIAALRQMRYQPATLDGKPIAVRFQEPVSTHTVTTSRVVH